MTYISFTATHETESENLIYFFQDLDIMQIE